MGGNIPSISTQAEFNFAMDPTAAATVLDTFQDRDTLVSAQTTTTCRQVDAAAIQTTWNRLVHRATTSKDSSTDKRTSVLQNVFHTNPNFNSLKHDAICAFSYYRPENVTMEQIRTRVDTSNGLLKPCSTDEDGQEHHFVTDFPFDGERGFLHWLQEAIEAR